MGSRDAAVKDGVRFGNDRGGFEVYYPKCRECGSEMMIWSYKSHLKYTCADCRVKNHLADREKSVCENAETKEKKFVNAVERIKKVSRNLAKYEYAINTIHKKIHTDGWFDSTEEIMVAIELVKNNIKARHQVKFGKYRVDFLLPDEKVVLEIDGHVFHTSKTREKEKLRDNLIIAALGAEWEVIRIIDTDINTNVTCLVRAIKAVKNEREKTRRLSNGQLNPGYCNKEL